MSLLFAVSIFKIEIRRIISVIISSLKTKMILEGFGINQKFTISSLDKFLFVSDLFDIPVYESKIQSLHAFFTLYSTMKSTQGQLIQEDNNEEQ